MALILERVPKKMALILGGQLVTLLYVQIQIVKGRKKRKKNPSKRVIFGAVKKYIYTVYAENKV
jgi:hypothetical protein